MKVVFAGTPEFAVPPLKALLADSRYEVVGVYTQPDRPAGRGRVLTESPVKQVAVQNGLPVFQPEHLKAEEDQIRFEALGADLMVVVAYGLILPKRVIDFPRMGCINIHASLLPRWRGAAPIQRSILAGDPETGVTIMYIEPKLDAGPMLLKRSTPIMAEDTAASLHDRLSHLGAVALMDSLPGLVDGTLTPEIQDEALVTYAAKLDKQEAPVNWSQSATSIHRQIQAFNPWPVAETTYAGKSLRIFRSEVLSTRQSEGVPGSVALNADQLDVETGEGRLRLLEVQLPGGKRITGRDFLNGQSGKKLHFGPHS